MPEPKPTYRTLIRKFFEPRNKLLDLRFLTRTKTKTEAETETKAEAETKIKRKMVAYTGTRALAGKSQNKGSKYHGPASKLRHIQLKMSHGGPSLGVTTWT